MCGGEGGAYRKSGWALVDAAVAAISARPRAGLRSAEHGGRRHSTSSRWVRSHRLSAASGQLGTGVVVTVVDCSG